MIRPKLMTPEDLAIVAGRHEFFRLGDVDAVWCIRLLAHAAAQQARIAELERLINSPRTDEFFEAVKLEAAHQVERWGAAHDDGKTDPDWFWLIGYLAGKALRGDEKRLHHIITTAAACLNWWRHATGVSTSMRPGIAEPCDRRRGLCPPTCGREAGHAGDCVDAFTPPGAA